MKRKRMFGLILLLICLGVTTIQAQQNVLSAGGEASGTGGTVSYSIGQIDYVMASGIGGTATHGLQQPIEIYVLGIDNVPSIQVTASVYPNPTASNVTLVMTEGFIEELSLALYDVHGRILLNQKISGKTTEISLEHLSTATYLLSITDNNSVLKTFKIIKN